MKVRDIVDAVGAEWLRSEACPDGYAWAIDSIDADASEIPSAYAAEVLICAPAGRLSPEQVAALVSRVTDSYDAAEVLVSAPADRLTAEHVSVLVARVRWRDAVWVLRTALAGRLTAEQREKLEAIQ